MFNSALKLRVIDKIYDNVADKLLTLATENLTTMNINDTGELRKSGYIKREFLKKEVGFSAKHAEYIEYGTAPHRPPIKKIEEWARRKLKAKNVEDAAWAIAKKIEEEGTEPKPFFRNAIYILRVQTNVNIEIK